jgi:hypothetical protein
MSSALCRGLAAVAGLAVILPAAGAHKPIVAAAGVPQARLPLTQVAPTLDGVSHDDEWAGGLRNAGLVTLRGGTLTTREAVSWLACDGTVLYIALRGELPPDGQVLGLHEGWQKVRIGVSVRNPQAEPLAVRVLLSDAWHFNPPAEQQSTVTVAPGALETAFLEAPDGGPAGVHRTIVRVASADGGTVYYARDVRWSLHRPEPAKRWSLGEESRKAVVLGFKYYPYSNQVRLRLDLGNLALKDKIDGGSAEIRRRDEPAGEPLWRQKLTFREALVEGVYAIPELADGTYRLDVRLTGEGAPTEPVTETFVRQNFEWERNHLGIAEEVMPPFTPMTVQGASVGCVLRQHRHGPAGLWDSLRSEGRELLAGPMRWEVETAAGALSVEGRGWSCMRLAATGVSGEARSGPLAHPPGDPTDRTDRPRSALVCLLCAALGWLGAFAAEPAGTGAGLYSAPELHGLVDAVTFHLSFDGGPFAVQALSARPAADAYGGFIVGATGGDPGLLDEVMAFNRPLGLDEVRALKALAAVTGP